ncbi:beta propeller repeat protein [Halalkalicoccus salilacus]|uniref:glycosyl hydrolase n=1 Tax=Halalkalicoccus salilacus TaxID=3117459 RepID=UPI00300EE35F
MGGALTLGGCIGKGSDPGTDSESEDNTTNNSYSEGNETNATTEDEDPIEERDAPEPEGGDGEPFTHYDLAVDDEHENGYPTWVDGDGRMYGRDGTRVMVSDDWWETTEELYDFGDEMPGDERVETVIVPESGNVLVGIGGKFDETTGRIELLADDLSGSETLYEFDWGRTSNSMGHAVWEDIVVISTYELSDFEGSNHANEVILSTDGGQSFEQVLEVPVVTTDAANNHVHDVEYDPYAERIWVLVGDHGNSQLYWSDDLGDSWESIGPRGSIVMLTQVAAFKDNVVFGTDGAPDGIILWERDGPDDAPASVDELERVHVEVKTDAADSGEVMQMYARRRWHIREDLEAGRELCVMPFGFSPMNEDANDSVVLASADGYVWYEVFRTSSRETLLTNVMGPLSMDASGDPAGDPRLLVSDSNQGKGYQADARLPPFWELDDADELREQQD